MTAPFVPLLRLAPLSPLPLTPGALLPFGPASRSDVLAESSSAEPPEPALASLRFFDLRRPPTIEFCSRIGETRWIGGIRLQIRRKMG